MFLELEKMNLCYNMKVLLKVQFQLSCFNLSSILISNPYTKAFEYDVCLHIWEGLKTRREWVGVCSVFCCWGYLDIDKMRLLFSPHPTPHWHVWHWKTWSIWSNQSTKAKICLFCNFWLYFWKEKIVSKY